MNNIMKVVLRSIGMLLMAVNLIACSSDEEGGKEIPQNEQGIEYDLKLVGGVSASDERALTFNTGTTIPKIIETSNWTTHVFFRKEGDNSFVGYAQIDWEFTGRNSEGRILLQQKNTRITLQNTKGITPRNGETWYIAGVAGGGKLNAEKNAVSFAYDEALDGVLKPNQVRLPLTFPWTKVKIVNNAPDEAFVNFTPQGTLLHFYLTNKAQIQSQSYAIITSSALGRDGGYQFAPATSTVSVGKMPTWSFRQNSTSGPTATTVYEEYTLALHGNKNATTNTLYWGMPRTGVVTGETNTLVSAYGSQHGERQGILSHRVYNKNTTTEYSSPAVFRSGRAYQIHLDVHRPWLPLDYVATNDVAANKTSFMTSQSNDVTGFLTWQEATNLNIKGYHCPQLNEWMGIFFNSLDRNVLMDGRYDALNKKVTETNVPIPGVKVGNTTFDVTANYAYTNDGLNMYVLAYFIPQGGDPLGNRHCIAYKYQRVNPQKGSLTSHMKITSRYLGQSFKGQVTDINKDAFWTKNNGDDVVRIFPFRGDPHTIPGETHRYQLGTSVDYWSATAHDATQALNMEVSGQLTSLGVHKNSRYHVRLFKDNL